MILALMARFLEKLISPPEMKASCQERRDRVTFLVMHDCYADCGHLKAFPTATNTYNDARKHSLSTLWNHSGEKLLMLMIVCTQHCFVFYLMGIHVCK